MARTAARGTPRAVDGRIAASGCCHVGQEQKQRPLEDVQGLSTESPLMRLPASPQDRCRPPGRCTTRHDARVGPRRAGAARLEAPRHHRNSALHRSGRSDIPIDAGSRLKPPPPARRSPAHRRDHDAVDQHLCRRSTAAGVAVVRRRSMARRTHDGQHPLDGVGHRRVDELRRRPPLR